MTAIEKLGLLKMDFLGLTTLTIIDDALKLIEQTAAQRSISKRFRSTTEDLREGLSHRPHLRRLPV